MVRTLHADIITAQVSASRTPYIKLVFHSFDRATTRSYATDDATNRILQVQQAEGRFGSHTLAEGRPIVVSSIIRLQNSDESLSGLDFKGYRVYIEWGFNTVSGNKTSRSGPEFVISQEFLSDEGISYLELYTINLWEMANQLFVNIGNTFPLSYTNGGLNETKISHILMELLGGGKLDDCTVDDGGVFTDYTSESEDTTNTATLFPTTPVVNDAAYFGQTLKFDRISFDVTQILSSGTITLTWEYYNGTVWSTLTALTTTTGGTANTHLDFTSTGIQIEAFDVPSDWTAVAVDGGTSMFFIRARVSAVSTPSQEIQATRIFAGLNFAFALDTDTSGQGDAVKPTYTTVVDSTLGPVIEDIMDFTKMGVRVREDGFHAVFVDVNQASPDEIYDLSIGPHTFHIFTESQSVAIPNRILVVSGNLDDGAATFSDTYDDLVSQGEIGIIPRIYEDLSVTSDADALTRATDISTRIRRDRVQGRVEVPMHVGQEIWDEVRVQDQRTGHESPGTGALDGRVSQIVRIYQSGEYLMQIIMGGAIWGVTARPLTLPISQPASAPSIDMAPDVAVPRPTVISVPDPRVVPTPVPGIDVPGARRAITRQERQARADEVIRRQGAAPPGLGIPPMEPRNPRRNGRQ
jgi:hypothetical protein